MLSPPPIYLLQVTITVVGIDVLFQLWPSSSVFLSPPKMQVTITVVGIDVLFRVQSRDLMSLKLEQGRVTVDQRAVTRASGEPSLLLPSPISFGRPSRPSRPAHLQQARPIRAAVIPHCYMPGRCFAIIDRSSCHADCPLTHTHSPTAPACLPCFPACRPQGYPAAPGGERAGHGDSRPEGQAGAQVRGQASGW